MLCIKQLIAQYKNCDRSREGQAALDLCINLVEQFALAKDKPLADDAPLTTRQVLALLKGIEKIKANSYDFQLNLPDLFRLNECAFIILWLHRGLPLEDLNEVLDSEYFSGAGGASVFRELNKLTDADLEGFSDLASEALFSSFEHDWSPSHRERLVHHQLAFLYRIKGVMKEAYDKIFRDIQGQPNSNHQDFELAARIFRQRPEEMVEADIIKAYDKIRNYPGYQDILFFVPSGEGAKQVVDVLTKKRMGLEEEDQIEMAAIITGLLNHPSKINLPLLFLFKELREAAGAAAERVAFAKHYLQLISALIKDEKDEEFQFLFMLFLSRNVRKAEWGNLLTPGALSFIEQTKSIIGESTPAVSDPISLRSIALGYLGGKSENFLSVDSVLDFFKAIVDSHAHWERIVRKGGEVEGLIKRRVFPMINDIQFFDRQTNNPERPVVILSHVLRWVENGPDDRHVHCLPHLAIDRRNSVQDVLLHLADLNRFGDASLQLDRREYVVVKNFLMEKMGSNSSLKYWDLSMRLSLVEELLKLIRIIEETDLSSGDPLLLSICDCVKGYLSSEPLNNSAAMSNFFNAIGEAYVRWKHTMKEKSILKELVAEPLAAIFKKAWLEENGYNFSKKYELSIEHLSELLQVMEGVSDVVVVSRLVNSEDMSLGAVLASLKELNETMVDEANLVSDAYNACLEFSSNEGTSAGSTKPDDQPQSLISIVLADVNQHSRFRFFEQNISDDVLKRWYPSNQRKDGGF